MQIKPSAVLALILLALSLSSQLSLVQAAGAITTLQLPFGAAATVLGPQAVSSYSFRVPESNGANTTTYIYIIVRAALPLFDGGSVVAFLANQPYPNVNTPGVLVSQSYVQFEEEENGAVQKWTQVLVSARNLPTGYQFFDVKNTALAESGTAAQVTAVVNVVHGAERQLQFGGKSDHHQKAYEAHSFFVVTKEQIATVVDDTVESVLYLKLESRHPVRIYANRQPTPASKYVYAFDSSIRKDEQGRYIIEALIPSLTAKDDWIFTLERQVNVSMLADYVVTLLELNEAVPGVVKTTGLSIGGILAIVFGIAFFLTGLALVGYVFITRRARYAKSFETVGGEQPFSELRESLYTPPTSTQ